MWKTKVDVGFGNLQTAAFTLPFPTYWHFRRHKRKSPSQPSIPAEQGARGLKADSSKHWRAPRWPLRSVGTPRRAQILPSPTQGCWCWDGVKKGAEIAPLRATVLETQSQTAEIKGTGWSREGGGSSGHGVDKLKAHYTPYENGLMKARDRAQLVQDLPSMQYSPGFESPALCKLNISTQNSLSKVAYPK